MTFIDNLLNDSLIVEEEFYKYLGIVISFVLSLLFLYLLVEKYNTLILTSFLAVLFISIGLVLYSLSHGVYISMGYFWVSYSVHFSILSSLYIVIDALDRKLFVEELNRSHVALLDSMVHVAEVHDLETGAHIVRTKKYIELLATYIYNKGVYKSELSPAIIERMYSTAPLHDIGKVGISDSILKKSGKLTFEEFEVMKTHSDLGRKIISNAIISYKENAFFIMAKNIAYSHHEKWDGTGYPEGLSGNDIPLEARFMALSDVYDALVSKRVYKESFSYDKTISIIVEGRAKHFDPVLVDAFLEIHDQFEEIAENHSDSSINKKR